MMRQVELVERVAQYTDTVNEALLNKAYVYAMHMHRDQKRINGDPYFSHPLEVAAIVTDMRLDESTVAAALLHDTIEDTEATRAEIDRLFGNEIGTLVEGLTKLKRIDLVSMKSRQGENLRRLLLAVSADVRVLLVKLADRLHNMRTLHFMPEEKRARIAQETMDIYAPLAGRMGMQDMRDELEETAFKHLFPEAYETVKSRLDVLQKENANVLSEIEASLHESLQEHGITAVVRSRSKKPYSIFRKMERNAVSFEQLSDIFGFRLIVGSVDACYQALGAVHTRWPSVPGRFKDYISTPKQNDYQSIHTTIVGPSRQRVELQIRTQEMHDIAEYGIAAHALYKDGIYDPMHQDLSNRLDAGENMTGSRSYAWLRRTVEALAEGDHPDDFLEQTRLELFTDQVFCFTPKGRLIALPQGATPIDFAYAVHTDIGNTCIGCRINGQSMPLVTRLANGDEVEIICGASQPQPVWEKVVVTGKARAGIRRATREAAIKQFARLGENILERAFKRAGKDWAIETLDTVLPKLARATRNEALVSVGKGDISPSDVVKAVYPDYKQERAATVKPKASEGWFSMSGVANLAFRIPGRKRAARAGQKGDQPIPVRGMSGDLPVSFDKAGGAVPGDRIVGILSKDVGITVYPIQSPALQAFEDSADEWLDLRWDLNPDAVERFPAKVQVVAVNSPGTLAEITEVIANLDCNIATLFMTTRESELTTMVFGVEVWDLKHVTRIIRELRRLPVVSSVERVYE